MVPRHYAPYVIAFSATLVRYYDYAIFGLSAAVMSKTFMPGEDEINKFLGFFAVFSIAVIARPIGAIIFGRIGDRIGRVAAVKNSSILGIISTGFVAFIPGYDVIGVVAIILLTLCRLVFLVSLAGEADALRIYVVERIGKKNRNLTNGVTSFCAQTGVLLAAFMYHFMSNIDDYTWLWRFNFIIGSSLGMLVIFFRKPLQENEVYLKSKLRDDTEANSGLLMIISENKSKFSISVVLNGMLGGIYNFLIIFLGTFAGNVVGIIPPSLASSNNILLISIYGFACLFSGFVADKIDSNKQIPVALAFSILCMLAMQFFSLKGVFLSELHMLIVAIVPFFTIPMQIKIQSLFTTTTRMRMCSLSHSLGSMLFSSTTPFFCILIWKYTELFSMVLSFFMLQVAVMFFLSVFMNRKNFDNKFET